MFPIIVGTLDNNINSSVSQKTNNSHYFCDFVFRVEFLLAEGSTKSTGTLLDTGVNRRTACRLKNIYYELLK